MRSKLFVPASRPEWFLKALSSEADAISFDLEDAVTPLKKEEARAHLQGFFETVAAQESQKRLIVRVNAVDSPHFEADLDAVVNARLDYLNLPKVSRPEEIDRAVALLAEREAKQFILNPIPLLINIETPEALRCAHVLARAHPRVCGLQLGLGDLFESLGILRAHTPALDQTLFRLRLAAGEAGAFAYDSAFPHIQDIAGFQEEALRARHFGFMGKSCIHPSQVSVANKIFSPTPDEISRAFKIVETASHAASFGQGISVLEGQMIDAPFLQRAKRVLAEAKRLGLLS